ncbi:MAG: hypothetical protein IIZ06_05840, partial [Kiritimatiellae bacterium]|nr:hypothetical protein [Kiritimatiellia bacterium]
MIKPRWIVALWCAVVATFVAVGGMPVNPKLPMSFGVDSTGRNRFVGEFKDIELSFGGKMYHSGPAKAGDRVKQFPAAAD